MMAIVGCTVDVARTCTGVTATWCPLCGDCICERREDGEVEFEVEFDGDGNCPLHTFDSPHATGLMERALTRQQGRMFRRDSGRTDGPDEVGG